VSSSLVMVGRVLCLGVFFHALCNLHFSYLKKKTLTLCRGLRMTFFGAHFAMFVCEWADFVKAKCLMNAEVALVLQRKYEQLQQLSEDPVSQISQ
jgi:hypothetical protein